MFELVFIPFFGLFLMAWGFIFAPWDSLLASWGVPGTTLGHPGTQALKQNQKTILFGTSFWCHFLNIFEFVQDMFFNCNLEALRITFFQDL